jgi:hypothetical protein
LFTGACATTFHVVFSYSREFDTENAFSLPLSCALTFYFAPIPPFGQFIIEKELAQQKPTT